MGDSNLIPYMKVAHVGAIDARIHSPILQLKCTLTAKDMLSSQF